MNKKEKEIIKHVEFVNEIKEPDKLSDDPLEPLIKKIPDSSPPNEKEEGDSRPHFVNTTNPEKEPWITNIYFGQRDGLSAHAHIALSGSAILYLRDEQGKEIILNGKAVSKNIPQEQPNIKTNKKEDTP